jgi:hypothetical protein
MTTVFTPAGPSLRIQYADDSTDSSVQVPGANAWLVFNPDNTHAACVSFGFTDGTTDAVMPLNNDPGVGTVVGQRQQVVISVPQSAYNSQLWVSVAGDGGTGNVFLTPGTV